MKITELKMSIGNINSIQLTEISQRKGFLKVQLNYKSCY